MTARLLNSNYDVWTAANTGELPQPGGAGYNPGARAVVAGVWYRADPGGWAAEGSPPDCVEGVSHSATSAIHYFPGGTTDFLRADGTFASPPGGGASTLYAPGSFIVATGSWRDFVKRGELTGSQRATVQGTARVSVRN